MYIEIYKCIYLYINFHVCDHIYFSSDQAPLRIEHEPTFWAFIVNKENCIQVRRYQPIIKTNLLVWCCNGSGFQVILKFVFVSLWC